ncbi:MAG: hypothetical protein LBJ92_00245 [Holosporales bacterium]|nr:hypothetical protein [Holosporales bacterium]
MLNQKRMIMVGLALLALSMPGVVNASDTMELNGQTVNFKSGSGQISYDAQADKGVGLMEIQAKTGEGKELVEVSDSNPVQTVLMDLLDARQGNTEANHKKDSWYKELGILPDDMADGVKQGLRIKLDKIVTDQIRDAAQGFAEMGDAVSTTDYFKNDADGAQQLTRGADNLALYISTEFNDKFLELKDKLQAALTSVAAQLKTEVEAELAAAGGEAAPPQ